ncbi:acyltransferase family protein [Aeromonas dhakensis]|uniref:acyltransferase family protein n=1 Tax=Aeromonas dhakensis TaxID=196024 RepID=UPI003BA0F64D
MILSELLKKEKNNIDIFRVIAACMVIWGHAYVLSPEDGKTDFISSLLPHDSSGSLAVKIFFFLSGLVVTNSLVINKDPIKFIVARFFRIWPALILTCLIVAFVIGPLLSTLTVKEYFSADNNIFLYVINNSLLKTQYNLPGVFTTSPHPISVNGSLWTIPYEVYAYALLLSLYFIGALKYKIFNVLFLVAITIESLSNEKIIFTWAHSNSEVPMLAVCFAFGSILALYKDVVKIDIYTPFALLLAYYLLIGNEYASYLSYASIFLFILYASSTRAALKLKPKFDISYGVYLWGFPVQQVISQFFLNKGILFNQCVSLLLSIILGFLSWYLCEKHFIKLGSKVSMLLTKKTNIERS